MACFAIPQLVNPSSNVAAFSVGNRGQAATIRFSSFEYMLVPSRAAFSFVHAGIFPMSNTMSLSKKWCIMRWYLPLAPKERQLIMPVSTGRIWAS